MNEFVKLLKTTEVLITRDVKGLSPQIVQNNSDCVSSNCDGGWGACECNCDCSGG